MCGIFGYIGKKQAIPFLINGLEKLDYRGYDSIGVCLSYNNELVSYKGEGKISDHKNNPELKEMAGTLGIAHTRWATHGKPSKVNSHPHFDCQKKIAVVHNGIIENHQELRLTLEQKGHQFISQTDTEVIPHLIEEYYKGDMKQAILKAMEQLKGSYALAIVSSYDQKIFAVKNGSPLLVATAPGGLFIASDSLAMKDIADEVIYLQDNEIAELDFVNISLQTFLGDRIFRKAKKIEVQKAILPKHKTESFMLKEIFEQPAVIKNILNSKISTPCLKPERIIFVACGTSYYAGLIGKIIFENLAQIPTEVSYASEFRYSQPLIKKSDLVIAISQSGETADTIKALELVQQKGARTFAIINVKDSTIDRMTKEKIYLQAGPEVSVAATKAFTAQISVLFKMAYQFNRMDCPIPAALLEIPNAIEQVLSQNDKIEIIAKQLMHTKNCLYLGRGVNFPVALEGALKLKEVSYIHAEAYPAGEMKHGPLALIDENTPAIFLATKAATDAKVLSNMSEVKARGGNILAIVNKGNKEAESLADYCIEVPETKEMFSSLINVIPLQLLAYHIAKLKGLNVDKPRNLAKSVTVE